MLRQLSLLFFTASVASEAMAFSCAPYALKDAINDSREAVAIFSGTILEVSRFGNGCALNNSSRDNKHYPKVVLRVDEPTMGAKQGDIFPVEYIRAGRYYYDEECNLTSNFPVMAPNAVVDVNKPSHLVGRSDKYFLFQSRDGALQTQPACFGYSEYEATIEAAIEADAYAQLVSLAMSVPSWIGERSFNEILAWKIDALELQEISLSSNGNDSNKQALLTRELNSLLRLRDKIALGHATNADQNELE